VRRTGHEALYSRIVEMDVRAKERELIEKEVNKFFCEGGSIRCPVCDCEKQKPISAKSLRIMKDYEPLTEEQKERNLESNLDHYVDSLEIE
jgi:hypothetical protein